MKRLLIILLLISNIGWSQSAEKKTVQSVSKYSVPLDKNTKERRDTETTSTGSNQDSFNYYYSQYLNSESSNKDYQSLLSAYRMNPNYSELYFEMAKYYELSNETLEFLRNAANSLNFSARSFNRIKKISRTIADLDSSVNIEVQHVAEAIQYRSLERLKQFLN